MSTKQHPKDILDRCLEKKPGCGLRMTFQTKKDRERFRWRCYAAMSAEAKTSRRELERTSAGWGKHPWEDIEVSRVGEMTLWIGRRVDVETIIVEDVSQEAED